MFPRQREAKVLAVTSAIGCNAQSCHFGSYPRCM
jgi:hypothetical protein